jgi:predicted porin
MKNQLLIHRTAVQAAACGLIFALSSSAWAFKIGGTDVSVNGRVVAGLDFTTHVAKPDGSSGSLFRAASNQWGTSMLTVAAEHAFGNGNVGFVTLETGFGSNTGASNDSNLWNRRAYVGVKNSRWGKLQFGKNLSISNSIWDIDPMGQNWSGSATLMGGRNWNSAPGAIEYSTPDLGGAGVTLQYSPGGTVGSSSSNTKAGIDLFYNKGPLSLHAIYDTAANASGRFDNVYNASKEYIVGGTYQLGAAKLFAGFNQSSATDALAGAPTRASQGWIGVNYQLGQPLLLRAAIYSGGSNVDATVGGYGGKKGTLLTLGADYAMDKQVTLWATVAAVKNGSNSRFSSGNYWDTLPLAGQSQNTVNAGFSYSF